MTSEALALLEVPIPNLISDTDQQTTKTNRIGTTFEQAYFPSSFFFSFYFYSHFFNNPTLPSDPPSNSSSKLCLVTRLEAAIISTKPERPLCIATTPHSKPGHRTHKRERKREAFSYFPLCLCPKHTPRAYNRSSEGQTTIRRAAVRSLGSHQQRDFFYSIFFDRTFRLFPLLHYIQTAICIT